MKNIFKVVNITSAHPRNDTRIFLKECRSLASAGHHVSLVVADGKGDETKGDVSIFDVGYSHGRLNRIFKTTQLIFEKAKRLDADIYHLHDPELIPIGLKLKRMGKTVIFDAHEDVPKQMLGKPYLSKPTRWMLSKVLSAYESWVCKRFDLIITATPCIRDKFITLNCKSVDINNFPMLGELAVGDVDWTKKKKQLCYVGGIGSIRGIKEVVQSMELVQSGSRLQLCGRFSEKDVEGEVKSYPGWHAVDELGFVDREGIRNVLACSVAGLVTFLPLPNHIDAQPNKMFEYMSAGIPVVASHFPLWREIVEGNNCGLCVDPEKPESIARAIDYLVNHPEEAEQMGINGQQAVNQKYNWSIEETKLLKLYENLM